MFVVIQKYFYYDYVVASLNGSAFSLTDQIVYLGSIQPKLIQPCIRCWLIRSIFRTKSLPKEAIMITAKEFQRARMQELIGDSPCLL